MFAAIMFNKATGAKPREVSAEAYARMLEKNPGLAKQVELLSPQRLVPVVFRAGGSRQGETGFNPPQFASARGYGLSDHVFEREKNSSAREAVQAGKKVILSLNLDLAHHEINFRGMTDPNTKSAEEWYQENQGNYISLSARSVHEAAKIIRAVDGWAPKRKHTDTIFPLYRGAVVPYDYFFLNGSDERISAAFDGVSSLQTGIALGPSRAIGFPRMVLFKATETTREEGGRLGIKAENVKRDNGHTRLQGLLIFEDRDIKASPAYKRLFAEATGNPRGVWVLACPSVTRPTDQAQRPQTIKRDSGWQHMRWIINDIDAQTAPAGSFSSKNPAAPAP